MQNCWVRMTACVMLSETDVKRIIRALEIAISKEDESVYDCNCLEYEALRNDFESILESLKERL